MKEQHSITLPLASLLIVGGMAICGVVVWKVFLSEPVEQPLTHITTVEVAAPKTEPPPPPSIPVTDNNPTPLDLLPPLPGRALPVLRSISDIFEQATNHKPPFTASTLRKGENIRYEIILQPDWLEASSADFDSSFLFGDEVFLGIRTHPLPTSNTPNQAHAGSTLDKVLSSYKDLRLRVQDTLEIAGESWTVFELGSPQASHLGLFTYAGPKGCFTLVVAARNRSFELRRPDWTRVLKSFRFPPR